MLIGSAIQPTGSGGKDLGARRATSSNCLGRVWRAAQAAAETLWALGCPYMAQRNTWAAARTLARS